MATTVVDDGAFELGTDGPKVIVAGVDGSPTSMRAGAYACGLARRQGARLVLVYVRSVGALGGLALGALGVPQLAGAFDDAADELRRQIEEAIAHRGVSFTFVTAQGDPFHELSRIADEVRADGIVVGASAKAGHRFVGSLAVRLVRAGRWPVTVVP